MYRPVNSGLHGKVAIDHVKICFNGLKLSHWGKEDLLSMCICDCILWNLTVVLYFRMFHNQNLIYQRMRRRRMRKRQKRTCPWRRGSMDFRMSSLKLYLVVAKKIQKLQASFLFIRPKGRIMLWRTLSVRPSVRPSIRLSVRSCDRNSSYTVCRISLKLHTFISPNM